MAPTELATVLRDRRRVLLTVLPVVAAACGAGTWVIASGPVAHRFDPYVFGGAGLLLLAVWGLLARRRIAYEPAAAIAIVTTGGILLARMASLFTGPYFDDPGVSMLNSIYAYFPAFFTLLTMLLPYPRSAHCGAAAWLVVAAFTTALTVPFWHETPPREGLRALLVLVWCGYPIFLALVASAARRHMRMVRAHADIAAAAEAANQRAQEHARRFEGIFNQGAVGIAMVDTGGRWLEVNPRVCRILGYEAAALRTQRFLDIMHPDDRAPSVARAEQFLRRELDSCTTEQRCVRGDGSVIWTKLFVTRVQDADVDRFVVALEDITERKTAEASLAALHAELEQRIEARTRELRASNERWQKQTATLALVNELASVLASAEGEDAIRSAAANLLPQVFPGTSGGIQVIGADRQTLDGCSWGEPAAGDTNRALRVPLVANGQALGVLHVAGGTPDAARIPMLGAVAEQLALALTNTRLRAELRAQALRDSLTGLYNRRYLNDFMPRAIASARRTRSTLSVLALDIDYFKRFNDSHGHEAGDVVLGEVARALGRSLRQADVAFRLGGEEFVAVLSAATPAEARAVAERVRDAVQSLQLGVRGRPLPAVTISVGMASLESERTTMDELLASADAALYRAKKEGRNCVRELPLAA